MNEARKTTSRRIISARPAAMLFVGLFLLSAWGPNVGAAEKPAPKKKDVPAAVKPPKRITLPRRPQVETAWIHARRKLEAERRPGGLRFGPTRMSVEQFYNLPPEKLAEVYRLLAEYDKERAARAAKWLEELRKIRDRYEEKLAALMPAGKQQQARAMTDLARETERRLEDLRAKNVAALAAVVLTREEAKNPARVAEMRKKKSEQETRFRRERKKINLVALRKLQKDILEPAQLKYLLQRVPLEWLRPKKSKKNKDLPRKSVPAKTEPKPPQPAAK